METATQTCLPRPTSREVSVDLLKQVLLGQGRVSELYELGYSSYTIDEGGQLPIFADELFSEMPAGFTGLMGLDSEVPQSPSNRHRR